jgi:hypothetical protein
MKFQLWNFIVVEAAVNDVVFVVVVVMLYWLIVTPLQNEC